MDRFWAKVQKTSTCWLWTAATNKDGYGCFKFNKKMVAAHRFSWELVNGLIPDGLQLDHLKDICGNRHCVNPSHLEIVTLAENVRRGDNNCRSWTHCLKGHEFTPENTAIRKGKKNGLTRRCCKECCRDQSRINRQRAKQVG